MNNPGKQAAADLQATSAPSSRLHIPSRLARPSRNRRRSSFTLTLLLLALVAHATPPAALAQHIPDVHTLSFSGDRIDLPVMLAGGKVAILVLGFSKGSRTQAALWGRRLPTDYLYSPDVLYFEMPMLEAVPRLLRGAVLRSIKSEVSARSQPHFAPLTSDEQRWRSLVRYNQPDDAYVLLIDSTGLVRAQFQGEPSDATYQELKHRVDQLQSTSTTK